MAKLIDCALALCIVFFLISGCSTTAPHCEEGYATLFSYVKKMEKEEPWYLSSYGGSFYGGVVRELYLGFHLYDRKVDIAEARRLLTTAANDFLAYINQNSKLQPHLIHSPFVTKDIQFRLSFLNDDDTFIVGDSSISSIFLMDGKIFYSVDDDAAGCLKRVHRETYEEALQIVQNEGGAERGQRTI